VPIWEGSRLSFLKYDTKKWRTAYIQSTAMMIMMMMMLMMMVVASKGNFRPHILHMKTLCGIQYIIQ